MSARVIIVGLALAFTAVAEADQLFTAEANLSPLVYQDENGYRGCGLRVVIVSINPDYSVRGGEFSVALFTRPTIGGLIKAGVVRCAAPCDSAEKMKYAHGADYQISSVKDGIPVKTLGSAPAEEKAFTLFPVDGVEATELLMKLRTGHRMQFTYKPDDSNYRETYSFVARPLAPAEAESFDACLDGALKE